MSGAAHHIAADGRDPSAAALGALVSFKDITKTFGATQALRGVSFDIRPGETLGLLGANGAGKSTLIKILSGMHRPTSGKIVVDGAECEFHYPSEARNIGIATVHQNIDDNVVFGMTVAENLLLDDIATPGGGIFLNRREILRRASIVQEKLTLELALTAPVESLNPSRRQELAIARELAKSPKLLILDEPTSTLSEREAQKLFAAVAEMKRKGIAILYISHRMSEVKLLCDRAVVLRNGMIVSEHRAPLDTRAVASSILGELVLSAKHASRPGGETVVRASGLRCKPEGSEVSISVRRGEVVGLTGLIGAGKTELLEQLCGHRPLVSGTVELAGAPYRPSDVADAMRNGVVMVPEQRSLQSIFPGDTLWQHCTIGFLGLFSRFGFLQRRREIAFARNVVDAFRVVCPGVGASIEQLSGGNQQKLLVGRWLQQEWKLVILDEPFRGIDIGARGLISESLRRFSEHTPVIVCSSDPEEVIEVADRVLIMVDERIVHEDKAANLTAEALAGIMSGAAEASLASNENRH